MKEQFVSPARIAAELETAAIAQQQPGFIDPIADCHIAALPDCAANAKKRRSSANAAAHKNNLRTVRRFGIVRRSKEVCVSVKIEQPMSKPRKTAKVSAPAVETAAIVPAAEAAEIIEAVSSPAVLSDVTEAAAAPALTEEVEKMATIEIPTVEKAQAMFGDMNDRIKTAFEKSTKMGEEIVDLAKGNAEAVVASAKIAAKGGETLGQEVAEYSKKSFENAMAVLKSLTQVRSPTEYFQLHSDFAKTSLESAVAEATKVSESMLKLAGEVVQPLSSRYAVAAEKIKTVTL
ncbi:phasin family protein [Sphingomonas vulcanisoli]|uniref:phasin family protein n=1 Tax=Sphingomonas vulcanisoli TaxID=1658060 RepID=UPI001FB8C115|nr:phasin family protein [Sphingomonas vulcanisoli]